MEGRKEAGCREVYLVLNMCTVEKKRINSTLFHLKVGPGLCADLHCPSVSRTQSEVKRMGTRERDGPKTVARFMPKRNRKALGIFHA